LNQKEKKAILQQHGAILLFNQHPERGLNNDVLIDYMPLSGLFGPNAIFFIKRTSAIAEIITRGKCFD